MATVLLSVCGPDDALAVGAAIATRHLRHCHDPNFDAVIAVMGLLPALLQQMDPGVAAFVRKSRVEPFFVLPWLISW